MAIVLQDILYMSIMIHMEIAMNKRAILVELSLQNLENMLLLDTTNLIQMTITLKVMDQFYSHLYS